MGYIIDKWDKSKDICSNTKDTTYVTHMRFESKYGFSYTIMPNGPKSESCTGPLTYQGARGILVATMMGLLIDQDAP